MRTHNKLIVSAAVAAALILSPMADARTIAVVVACNPSTPGAVSQMPGVSQGSSSTATAICPQGTYPSAAGLDGTQALLAGISAAALAGGGLALSNIGGASSGSSNARGLPGTSGSGNSGGVPGGSGSGGPSGGDNTGAPNTGKGSATSPAGAPAGSDGQTYPVSAHQITGFPSPEISPSQLTSYTPPASGPSAGGGSPNSNGGQSSGGQAGPGGSGLGSFFGHLAHAVGAAAQQIGHAVTTGSTVNIPILGGGGTHGSHGAASGGVGATADNTGSSGFNSLNHFTQVNPSGTVSPMTGAAAGTIELHGQPQPFTLTGGPNAYRGLVHWVSGFEGSVLDIGGGYLDTVVHPGTVTPERLPGSGATYYPYSRLSGYADFYITELGHRSVAYPGNPVKFVVQVPTGGDTAATWEAAQEENIQATGTYSSGPQFYASVPGNRNGPFWPSPFTLGGPEPDVAGVCHGLQQITHVSMGGLCWSVIP